MKFHEKFKKHFFSNVLIDNNYSSAHNNATAIKATYLNSAMNFHSESNQYVKLTQIYLSLILPDVKLIKILLSTIDLSDPSLMNGSLLHIGTFL